MPRPTTRGLADQFAALFDAGTSAGMTDGDLLERFRARDGESSERAFEALVDRHGPMVHAICASFLDDPGDLHDAYQAVFLVLARRAGAIRKAESLGSWLHGVSVRVGARARSTAIRRRVRERRAQAAAEAVASVHYPADTGIGPSRHAEARESAAAVHEEVVRLPESYRAPILLCYFEGLTHDEAAARLNWPVGTVRSRLARARDRLRGRLERRGIAESSAGGLMASFSGNAGRLARTTTLPPLPRVHLPLPTTRAAVRLAAGATAPAGSWPSASIVLADGVLQAMLIRKLTVVACVLMTLGVGTRAGISLVRRIRAQEASSARPSQARAKSEARSAAPEIDPQLKELIEAARKRVEAEKAYYEEGRITLDRFIQGLADLCDVELLAATTDAERSAIFQRKITLLNEIERREQGEFEVGRGTVADVAESRQARLRAEFDWKVRQKEQAEKTSLLHRIAELERKVAELQNERGGGRRP